MEEHKNDSNLKKFNPDVPTEKRQKETAQNAKLDDEGYLRTPNGSFWDPDGEYFNRNGLDVHGGFYSEQGEYIPGPEWLPEYGCYPEEKEKYLNINWDEFDAEGEEEVKEENKEEVVNEGELSDGWETVEEDDV
jgi:hypothetical protein